MITRHRYLPLASLVALAALSALSIALLARAPFGGGAAARTSDAPDAPSRAARADEDLGTDRPAAVASQALPDLRIEEHHWTYPLPSNACRLELRVCVVNSGEAPAGGFWIRGTGGAPSWRVYGLAPGAKECTGPRVSGWDFELIADADGEVEEADEANNRYVVPMPPVPTGPPCVPGPTATPGPQRPDLAVASAYTSVYAPDGPRCLILGMPFWTYGSIVNQGPATALDPFEVRAGTETEPLPLVWELGGLEPGALHVLAPRKGISDRMVVDPDGRIQELDETNNRLRYPIPTPPVACTPTPVGGGTPSATPSATPTPEPGTTPATPTPTPTNTLVPLELPDLVVASHRWQMEGFNGRCVPRYGGPELSVTVANQGLAVAGPFTVRTDGSGIEWRVETGLAPGRSEALPFATGEASWVDVDVDEEVDEADETNNRAAIPMPTWTPPPLCTSLPGPTDTPTPPTPVTPAGAPLFLPALVKGA